MKLVWDVRCIPFTLQEGRHWTQLCYRYWCSVLGGWVVLIRTQAGQVNSGISASGVPSDWSRLAEVHSLWEVLSWVAEYIRSHLFYICARLIIIDGFVTWECLCHFCKTEPKSVWIKDSWPKVSKDLSIPSISHQEYSFLGFVDLQCCHMLWNECWD